MIQQELTRRGALKLAGGAALLAVAGCSQAQPPRGGESQARPAAKTIAPWAPQASYRDGQYVLGPLPYAYDALVPTMDERTMRLHHDKHHAGYVKGLNNVLDQLAKARADGDFARIAPLSNALAFHGSGHMLHTLFWNSMTPGGAKVDASLAAIMKGSFGSVEAGQAQFAAACKAVEGSGWGVLAFEPISRKLMILQAEKHQNLTIWGVVPLLVCDVWEHAYYLQYANDRGKWVDGFMTLANWTFASQRMAMADQMRPGGA